MAVVVLMLERMRRLVARMRRATGNLRAKSFSFWVGSATVAQRTVIKQYPGSLPGKTILASMVFVLLSNAHGLETAEAIFAFRQPLIPVDRPHVQALGF